MVTTFNRIGVQQVGTGVAIDYCLEFPRQICCVAVARVESLAHPNRHKMGSISGNEYALFAEIFSDAAVVRKHTAANDIELGIGRKVFVKEAFDESIVFHALAWFVVEKHEFEASNAVRQADRNVGTGWVCSEIDIRES